jgi:ABC-type dipeptide/oligopeptide/nickel transport system permease component
VAMPLFWLGLLLVYVFYYLLGIAPAPTGRLDMLVTPPPRLTGLYVVDSLLSGDMEALWSSISHLVLPVMSLTFIVAASIARMTYTSMRRVLSAPYILVGHAYGISPHRLIYKFALKNALIPVITFVGLQIGFLIGGVVLIEVVFALPGIGRYAVDSLLVNDFAPVQGFVLVVLIVYLCVNLLADVLYGLVNPQVRAAME